MIITGKNLVREVGERKSRGWPKRDGSLIGAKLCKKHRRLLFWKIKRGRALMYPTN
jgi:hypothetical protein